MTTSNNKFNHLAKSSPDKALSPFSLRLTFEERSRLEKDAAGMPLGAYIRSKVFGEDAARRKTRGKFPVKDWKALSHVLGSLGKSRLANNLNQLARAANSGSLPVTPDTEKALREACKEVEAIRRELLRALGYQTGSDAEGDLGGER